MFLFWRKKKSKFNLPEPSPVDPPRPTSTQQRRNLYAEQYAKPREEGAELKSYEIYYKDRDFANVVGDPMLSVVKAYSAAEAELQASYRDSGDTEILAVNSSIEIVQPDTSEFAWPKSKEEKQKDDNSTRGGAVLRRKRLYD